MDLTLITKIVWALCWPAGLFLAVYQIACIKTNRNDYRSRFLALFLSVLFVMIFDSLVVFTLNSSLNLRVSFSILLQISLCGITAVIPAYMGYRWQIFLFEKAVLFFRFAAIALAVCYVIYMMITFLFATVINLELANYFGSFLYISINIMLILAVLYSFILTIKASPKSAADKTEYGYWKKFIISGFCLMPFIIVFHWLYAAVFSLGSRVPYEAGVLVQQLFYLLFFFTSWKIVRNYNKVPPRLSFGLTDREYEVAGHLIKGASYNTIADTLCISLSTVQSHVRKIYDKTECNNKTQLAVKLSFEFADT